MKVILLKDVSKVGRRLDVKSVSDGHAINFLIPRGLAVSATPEAMKRLEVNKTVAEGERKVNEELLVKNIGELEKTTVTITGKASDKGHLFAGIHKAEIVEALEKQTRLGINPEFILLEHPIKEVGEYHIHVEGRGSKGKFMLVVKPV